MIDAIVCLVAAVGTAVLEAGAAGAVRLGVAKGGSDKW